MAPLATLRGRASSSRHDLHSEWLSKILYFKSVEQGLTDIGLTDTGLLLRFAIGIELLGGCMLAIGWKSRTLAVGLITYLASATLLVHHDLSLEINRIYGLASLAFTGGLLMVVAHRSGVLSAAKFFKHRRQE